MDTPSYRQGDIVFSYNGWERLQCPRVSDAVLVVGWASFVLNLAVDSRHLPCILAPVSGGHISETVHGSTWIEYQLRCRTSQVTKHRTQKAIAHIQGLSRRQDRVRRMSKTLRTWSSRL